MKKTSKIILLITIILVIICAIVYVITIKLKQNDEKISKLESKISNAQENNENNNSINNTKIENISNNGIENAKENSNKIEDFSMNDLKIDGITFGSSKDQVIQKYGSDCTSKSYAEGATGETITELTYEKLGLLINLRTNEEGCSVDSIFILKNSNIKTARGIGINSTTEEILNKYGTNSILKSASATDIVVGFQGDNDLYQSKGRIYFITDGKKVTQINIVNTYGE